MSELLYNKIYNFLITSPLNHITSFSVIYQIMRDEPLIEKEELYKIVEKASNEALKTEKFQKMEAQDKISNIFEQFQIAFEGVCSIRNIEIDNKILNKEEIKYNINDLKKKLKTNNSSYASEIRLDLEHIDIDKLTWRDPIASQVISDDSDMIKNLSIGAYQSFMKLAKQMQVDSLPNIIQEECNQFLNDFKEKNLNLLCNKYKHNNTWIESNEKLCEITKEILNTLSNIWKNPAFTPEFANLQSEGTYVTDVIVPLLHAALKDLIVGNVNLLSTKASATRRKNYKKQGKRPDIMFMEKKDKLFELMFVECSRLICSNDKEEKDKIKLWREMNDGINYIYKKNRLDKDEFGILGIQIAGNKIHFNIIIRDISEVNRLYHLYSTEIPVQPINDKVHLLEFINVLLHIRNILTVNISLLLNALPIRSKRLRRQHSSYTISTDMEDD
ncbi:unnamed protein product [Rhizophagus irregularis]|nr:unnamed protein product [Rhizophagus irregularis]